MLIVVLVIAIIVIGVAAAYTLTAPPPVKSQIIIGTTDSVEANMDPAYAYDYFGWEMIQSLSSGLVEYRPGTTGLLSDIVPALATSWSNTSWSYTNGTAGGTVWTFNLRHGVYYQGGQEFNATDVKYSFDRGNIGINSPDGAFQGIGYAEIVKNVTVVDQFTVKFFTYGSYASFLALMTVPCTYMVDPLYAPYNEIINYTAGNPRGSYPGGLGPYLLQSWTRTAGKDVQIILTANPNYWNASGGFPKTKTVIINMYSSSAALTLAIKSHDIDIAFRQLDVSQFADLSSSAAAYGLKVWSAPSEFIQYLVFQESRAPFNDSALRIAVASAINRTLITSTVYANLATPLYSMIPNGMAYHRNVFNVSGGLNYANFNYTRTRQILEEKGYSKTNPLIVNLWYETSGHYPQSGELATALLTCIDAAAPGNISVVLHSSDWASMEGLRDSQSMDVFIMGWYPDFIETDDYITPFYQSSACSWLHDGYNNSYMDQLVAWSRFNSSSSIRDLNYYKIQNLSVSTCPLVPMYQYGQFAVTSLTIHGVVLDATMDWRNWLVYNGTS